MKISEIKKIELYIKGCYGCDKGKDYSGIQKFILHNKLPLSVLVVKRIELNMKWREEARKSSVECPFVVVSMSTGRETLSLEDFEKLYCKKKRKAAKKSGVTTTTSDSPSVVGDNDGEEKDDQS